GGSVRLPAKTASYQDWARLLVTHAIADALMAEKPYWREVETAATKPLPSDGPRLAHRYDETRTVEFGILLGSGQIPEIGMQAALLVALARALAASAGREATRIMLTGHGRLPPHPSVDVSRTVGW